MELRKKLSLILVPIMVLYIFLPCIAQAKTVSYTAPVVTKTLTYYCQGSTIMNTADADGNMSSYLGREVRSVIDKDGNISTNYLIKNGKDVIAKTQDGTTLSKTYQYTPYGKTVDFTKPENNQKQTTNTEQLNLSTNPFRYSSYYLDSESGLYYLNARYYSPELMRFISRDTYDLNNRYAYGNGNPISNVDPTGHMSTRDWIGIFVSFIPLVGNAYSAIDGGVRHNWLEMGLGLGFGALDILSPFLEPILKEMKVGAKVVNKVESLPEENNFLKASIKNNEMNLEPAKIKPQQRFGILGPTEGTKYMAEVRPGKYASLFDNDKTLYRGYNGIKKNDMENIIDDVFENGLKANPNKSSLNEESVFDIDGKIKENAYGEGLFTTSGISTTKDFNGTAKYFGGSCIFEISPDDITGFDFMGINVRQEVNVIHDIPGKNIRGIFIEKNLIPEKFANEAKGGGDGYYYIKNLLYQ